MKLSTKLFFTRNFRHLLSLSILLIGTSAFGQWFPGGQDSAQVRVWLKADGTNTLTNQGVYSTAGNTTPSVDGGVVNHWNNFLGTNSRPDPRLLNLTQGTATQQPLYYSTTFNQLWNYNPTVLFDGSNDVLRSAGTAFTNIFSQQNTIFQIMNYRGPDGTGVWFKWEDASTEGNRIGFESSGAGNNYMRFDCFNSTNCTPGGPCPNRQNIGGTRQIDDFYRLTTAHHNNAQSVTRVDGNIETTANFTGTSNINPTSPQPLQIGANSTAGAGDFWTNIAFSEIIVFNVRLNAAAIDKVESYLGLKYGLTLGHSYVSSTGVNWWNYGADGAYNKGIIGVAREDLQGLYQKQSMSMSRLVEANPNRDIITLFLGTLAANNQLNTATITNNTGAFMVGTNGVDPMITQNTENPTGVVKTLKREWFSQQSNFVNNDISITFDFSSNSNVFGLTSCQKVCFIMDADGNFSNGTVMSDASVNLVKNGNKYTVTIPQAVFAANPYFTFGVTNLVQDFPAGSTNVTCNRIKDGKIDETLFSAGTAPYTYSIDGGATTQATGAFGSLDTGTYYCEIKDNAGCIFRDTIKITEPTKVVPDTATTRTACPQVNTGQISITASGGTPGYTFSLDGVTYNSGVFTNLPDSTYMVKVKDAYGCLDSIKAIITAGPTPKITSSNDTALCAGNKVTLKATGPAGLTYTWDNGVSNNVQFTPVTTKMYHVVGKDAFGCQDTDSTQVTVNPIPNPTIKAIASNICNDTADFNLSADSVGGTWRGVGITDVVAGTFSPTASGIGNHRVIYDFTDGNGCFEDDTIFVKITQRADASMNPAGPFCNNASPYQLTTTNPGGTWSGTGVNSSGLFDPAAAGSGSHTIKYKIASACPDSSQITILVNSTFNSTINPAGPFCVSDSPSILPSATPGAKWDGPGIIDQNTGLFDPKTAGVGTHSIKHTVGGTASCATSDTKQFTVLPLDTAHIQLPNDSICYNAAPMQITADKSGGTWSGAADPSGQFDPAGRAPGAYKIYYTHKIQCQHIDSAIIRIPDTLEVVMPNATVPCFGNTTGALTATATDGPTPYTYSWSNNASLNSASQNNLPQGSYTITVTDALGCTAQALANISQPTKLQITGTAVVDDSCYQASKGTVQVSVTGGTQLNTGGYTYTNNPAQGVLNANKDGFNQLKKGSYRVTITDKNSCSVDTLLQVNEPALLTVTATSATDYCSQSIGSVQVGTTNGGTTPYTYKWNYNNTAGSSINNVPGSTTYTYIVTVTDKMGCTAGANTAVGNVAAPTIAATTTPVQCNGYSNGGASTTVIGGTGTLTYNWSDPLTANVSSRNNLPAGTNYTVRVTDSKGCFGQTSFNITEPSKVKISPVNGATVCYQQSYTGNFLAQFGNGGPYTYFLNNVQQPSSAFSLNTAGFYRAHATDSKGCYSDTTQPFEVKYTPTISAVISQPDTVCRFDTAHFTASANGGTAAFTFKWDNLPFTPQSTIYYPTGSSTPPSTQVRLIASNGCAKADTVYSAYRLHADPTAAVAYGPLGGCLPVTVNYTVSGNLSTFKLEFGDGSSVNDSITSTHIFPSAGGYLPSISGQTNRGCKFSLAYNTPVTVYGYPEADFSWEPTFPTVIDPRVSFTNQSKGYSHSDWTSLDTGFVWISSVENPTTTLPQRVGEYDIQLIVSSGAGCSDTIVHTVIVKEEIILSVPNAFTPNNDGLNDGFRPIFSDQTKLAIYEFMIFDRWGELVFYSQDPSASWDGTYKGDPCKPAAFNWKLRYSTNYATEIHHEFGSVRVVK